MALSGSLTSSSYAGSWTTKSIKLSWTATQKELNFQYQVRSNYPIIYSDKAFSNSQPFKKL